MRRTSKRADNYFCQDRARALTTGLFDENKNVKKKIFAERLLRAINF